ncbi:spermidine/putrescine transport system permease protein [Faunimonas pinastri]|uniref:Spermidine/putrescine transport system permease protein n=1 Tax=Faunimonas pinastri TaxID=1855383 RepID=A0A1H9AB89_9HYPH|nr:ABC transporter permease [Faunimonas pinastri]SEP73929.1 spermidine/putrescine transport system permease protein [Faunimonas pinastri]
MTGNRFSAILLRAYLVLFFLYLFVPLAIMGAATFNDSRFPTVMPWQGTTLKWFDALWADGQMWNALGITVVIGLLVVLISVPIGLAAALLLGSLHARARSFLYALMISPLLTPGVIIGISTLVFWRRFDVPGGIGLSVLAQSSYIAAYVMLMVTARLQRFDRSLEEAALDLGASHIQTFRRITLPYLRPALIAAAFIAFLQSFENYNTTLFVRGIRQTLTIYIATKVRTGVTPAVNALGLVLIAVTVVGAAVYEILRRRQLRVDAARASRAAEMEAQMQAGGIPTRTAADELGAGAVPVALMGATGAPEGR